MPKCSFCGNQYDVPRGKTFVLSNGEILYFCSSKCEKNNKLGRKKEKQKWVSKKKKSDKEEEKKVLLEAKSE